MIIGVPKEVKDQEWRVGIVPSGVKALVDAGHKVLVQAQAGEGSSMPDAEYKEAGAEIVGSAEVVWKRADMIVKVKEPVQQEIPHFRPGLVLFTYLHLAPIPDLTDALLKEKVAGIAYETVTDHQRGLPLLTPMSEVAGRMSVQVGAAYLEKEKGGRGVLLGGVPGVPPAKVVIIGGGVVGTNASAPKLVTRQMVSRMKKGSVIVDVAIDQGGCIETAKPTTHSNPAYTVDGVVHYCVTNMPGAVPHTSTLALTNATFPYVMKLASMGAKSAIKSDEGIRQGVNTYDGHVTYKAVAESQKRPSVNVADLI